MHRPTHSVSTKLRWQKIAQHTPNRTPRECLARCKLLAAMARRRLQSLPYLEHDVLLHILEKLPPASLCAFASTSKAMRQVAHAPELWRRLCDKLPPAFRYDVCDRMGEPHWKYCLRVRFALWGAWKRLLDHRAGRFPYLRELGEVVDGEFRPAGGVLPFRIAYGAVCELVQLQVRRDGGSLIAATYRDVADYITSHSADARSFTDNPHMTVREIYKTCYPGFGSGVGSTGVAPGVQAGGSSTKAGAHGQFCGKGVAMLTKRIGDEEQRKRLDTMHEFFVLVNH